MKPNERRILGIDLGTKRVGLAIADPILRIATALNVIEYKSLEKFLTNLKKTIDDEEIGLVVVGLPLNMDGSEGEKARQARKIADRINTKLGVAVELVDETLTTSQATDHLHAAGGKVGKSRSKLDMMAAMVILQDYLDAQPPEKR
jgi:putative Holliday junction resolvase